MLKLRINPIVVKDLEEKKFESILQKIIRIVTQCNFQFCRMTPLYKVVAT